MNKRIMRGGVAVALAAALAMSGCAGDKSTDATGGGTTAAGDAKPAADTPKDATAAIVGGAKKLQEQSFKSTIDMGGMGSMNGVMDPTKNLGEFTMEVQSEGTKVKTEIRIIDGTNYVRVTMPGTDLPGLDGKTWRKLDGKGGAGTLGGFNGGDTAKTLENAADVKWTGDNALTGTIDLAKAGTQLGLGANDLSKLSTSTIPFEATLDGEGRLTRYALTIPAIGGEPATEMDMTYSDFGVPVDVKAPAASEIATS